MRQLKVSYRYTDHSDKNVDRYLRDVQRHPLLPTEEELDVAQRASAGDREAFLKLVNGNLRFVVSVAKQYQNKGLSLPDLISEGNEGLLIAAERFDATKGFKFISYAVWWIRQRIMQSLDENSRLVKLPLNKSAMLARISHAGQRLSQELQREPTVEEINECFEEEAVEHAEIRVLMGMGRKHQSFDAPIDDDDLTFADILPDEDSVTDKTMSGESLRVEISRSLRRLPEKQREVLTRRYGLDGKGESSREAVARAMGLTPERVRQLEECAKKNIRSRPGHMRLKEFL